MHEYIHIHGMVYTLSSLLLSSPLLLPLLLSANPNILIKYIGDVSAKTFSLSCPMQVQPGDAHLLSCSYNSVNSYLDGTPCSSLSSSSFNHSPQRTAYIGIILDTDILEIYKYIYILYVYILYIYIYIYTYLY